MDVSWVVVVVVDSVVVDSVGCGCDSGGDSNVMDATVEINSSMSLLCRL